MEPFLCSTIASTLMTYQSSASLISSVYGVTLQGRYTPLHLSVRAGKLETVRALLNIEGSRKSVNYQDKVG